MLRAQIRGCDGGKVRKGVEGNSPGLDHWAHVTDEKSLASELLQKEDGSIWAFTGSHCTCWGD